MNPATDSLRLDVQELLDPILVENGLELFDIEFKGKGRHRVLRIYIDKPKGVTIDDCASVSREIGNLLDIHDIIPGTYTLEVSSPGLTRPLRGAGDYVKYIGRLVKVKTTEPIENNKIFVGELVGFENNIITVETDDHIYDIPLENVEKANLELEF